MAEHLRRDRLCDMEPEQIPANDPPHGLLGQRHFPVVQQQSVCLMDLLPAAAAVRPQNMKDFWRLDLDDPLLTSLPIDQEPQLVLIQLDGLR